RAAASRSPATSRRRSAAERHARHGSRSAAHGTHSMSDARAILRRAGLTPKKGFGQNFLVADGVVAQIAPAWVPDDEIGRARVVELGAGVGALTHALAERAGAVVAVERDRDLIPILREEMSRHGDRVRVEEADAQAVDPHALLGDV